MSWFKIFILLLSICWICDIQVHIERKVWAQTFYIIIEYLLNIWHSRLHRKKGLGSNSPYYCWVSAEYVIFKSTYKERSGLKLSILLLSICWTCGIPIYIERKVWAQTLHVIAEYLLSVWHSSPHRKKCMGSNPLYYYWVFVEHVAFPST